jgi:hypothetical protein
MSLFSEIVFGKQVLLDSPLSKEDALKNLKSRTSTPVKFKIFEASKSFVGQVQEQGFSLKLQHKYRNGLSPKILGTMESLEAGTAIRLHIRVSPIALSILFFFLFALIGLAIFLLALSHLDEWMDIFMMTPLIIFLLLLFLTVLNVQHEIESVEKNLRRLFEVTKN